MDYKKAGVDIEAGYRSVELMKEHVKKRRCVRKCSEDSEDFREHFLLIRSKKWKSRYCCREQTAAERKVKLSMVLDKHDTIGIDAVAMCVNDIAVREENHCFSLIILHAARMSLRRSHQS